MFKKSLQVDCFMYCSTPVQVSNRQIILSLLILLFDSVDLLLLIEQMGIELKNEQLVVSV
jgi:hypothetical protein